MRLRIMLLAAGIAIAAAAGCGLPGAVEEGIDSIGAEGGEAQLGRLTHAGGWNEAKLPVKGTGDTVFQSDLSNADYTCWLRVELVTSDPEPSGDAAASYKAVALIQRDGGDVSVNVPVSSLPRGVQADFAHKNITKKQFLDAVGKHKDKTSGNAPILPCTARS